MICKHKWEWYDAVVTEVFASTKDTMPVRVITEVMGQCAKCGMPKVKEVKGSWHPKRGK